MKKENFEMGEIIQNIDKVKEMKAGKKKRPNASIKPLVFEPHPDDSPLKAEIIRRINEKNLTYSDIYKYCIDLKDGDVNEGQNLGYNIIYGLRKRHTMIDTTFSMLCDFLNLDVMLVDKEESEEEVDE